MLERLNHNYNNISTYPFNIGIGENPHRNNSSYPQNHPITKGDIHVGNDVWIGRDSIIMSGVTIGDGAIIGARAVVTKDVEPYSIVGGVPARHIRYRIPEDKIPVMLNLKWWDWEHEDIEKAIPLLMSSDIDGLVEQSREKTKHHYRGYRIGIVTRSMNDDLYNKMRELYPSDFKFIRVTDCHGVEGAVNYLYKLVFMEEFDWVINIDEDFFTYDPSRITSLLDHMIDNDIDYCGISDGGMCIHRFHSPIVVNPFFNIFNTKKIREALDDINYVQNNFFFNESMLQYMPPIIKEGFPWVNDNFEPYYQFFYWLPCRGFKPLYLESYELPDENISTIVKNHLGEEIGIHTWFTREYGRDQYHTDRIINAYNLAKSYESVTEKPKKESKKKSK